MSNVIPSGLNNMTNHIYANLDYNSRTFPIKNETARWVYDNSSFRGLNWIKIFSSNVERLHNLNVYKQDPYRYLCSSRFNGIDATRTKHLSNWRWFDGKRLVPALDSDTMAKIIQSTSLRFVGDSLMGEMFSSLVGLLANKVDFERSLFTKDKDGMLVFLHNGGSLSYDKRKINIEDNFKQTTLSNSYVLVLDSTMPLKVNNCNSSNRDIGKVVSQNYHGRHVIYIAMDPTHPSCANYKYNRMKSAYSQPGEPLKISSMKTNQLYDYRRWCWNKIVDQTHYDIDSLHQWIGRERLIILNMSELTRQRRDSHSIRIPIANGKFRCCDCMHHCIPGGPIETWNDALYHALNHVFIT